MENRITMSPQASQFNYRVSTNRLEVFGDGVFAIAITLLADPTRPEYVEVKNE